MTNEEASFILANIDRRVCDDELNDALDMAIKALEQQTTRPTARWERLVDDFKKCSKCGKPVKFYRKHEYCPGCGAKMQKEEEE